MKTGQAVHEPDARVDRALRVVPRGLLGADRQVADEHVGLRVAQDLRDVASGRARTR